jgi:hypothetical protein
MVMALAASFGNFDISSILTSYRLNHQSSIHNRGNISFYYKVED